MEENLFWSIKPAIPTETTTLLNYANAKNWTHTTLQILEEHYLTIIIECRNKLIPLNKSDWERALLVATKWIQRDLPKIQGTTLNQAQENLKQLMSEITQAEPDVPPPQTQAQTPQPETSDTEEPPPKRKCAKPLTESDS